MSLTSAPWVLDTHIWIRTLSGDPLLNRPPFLEQLAFLSRQCALLLASISLWETAMLVSKGRLTLTMPVQEWMDTALIRGGITVIPLTTEISTDSAALPGTFHGDPADRIIVATARRHNATLITLDRKILSFGEEGWVHSTSPGSARTLPPTE